MENSFILSFLFRLCSLTSEYTQLNIRENIKEDDVYHKCNNGLLILATAAGLSCYNNIETSQNKSKDFFAGSSTETSTQTSKVCCLSSSNIQTQVSISNTLNSSFFLKNNGDDKILENQDQSRIIESHSEKQPISLIKSITDANIDRQKKLINSEMLHTIEDKYIKFKSGFSEKDIDQIPLDLSVKKISTKLSEKIKNNPKNKHHLEYEKDANQTNTSYDQTNFLTIHEPNTSVIKNKELNVLEFSEANRRKLDSIGADSLEPSVKRICCRETNQKFKGDGIHEEKNNFDQESPIIQSPFLRKFDAFLNVIESLIHNFLIDSGEPECELNKILYDTDLKVLENFQFDLFGTYCAEKIDELNKVSSTADMLSNFIKKIKIENFKLIYDTLITCVSQNIEYRVEIKDLPEILLSEILIFLKSEESKYLKSIVTEFYSFIHLYDELKKEIDFENLDITFAFIPFLIVVKRNIINTLNLKKKLIIKDSKLGKRTNIMNEISNCSAFFFVFINNMPFIHSQTMIYNTKTSILFKSITNQYYMQYKRSSFFGSVKLINHLYFDLRNHIVLMEYITILNLSSGKLTKKKFYDTKQQINEVKKYILINKIKYIDRIKESLDLNMLSNTFNTNIKEILSESNRVDISNLLKIFELTHTYSLYRDCRIGEIISSYFQLFYQKIKNTEDK